MKTCTKCKIPKELSEFYKAREYKGKIYFTSQCKKCLDEKSVVFNKIYRKGNKEFHKKQYEYKKYKMLTNEEYRERIRKEKRDSNTRNIVHVLWKRTRDRAIKKGIEFTLLQEDVVIPKFCPILEIPIFCGERKNYNNSPTIDRKDNSKGYTKENFAVISMLANTMKNAASKEHLEAFVKNIFTYLK